MRSILSTLSLAAALAGGACGGNSSDEATAPGDRADEQTDPRKTLSGVFERVDKRSQLTFSPDGTFDLQGPEPGEDPVTPCVTVMQHGTYLANITDHDTLNAYGHLTLQMDKVQCANEQDEPVASTANLSAPQKFAYSLNQLPPQPSPLGEPPNGNGEVVLMLTGIEGTTEHGTYTRPYTAP
jgi:hypothetical protein